MLFPVNSSQYTLLSLGGQANSHPDSETERTYIHILSSTCSHVECGKKGSLFWDSGDHEARVLGWRCQAGDGRPRKTAFKCALWVIIRGTERRELRRTYQGRHGAHTR